jgi:Transposase DDE domain
MARRFVVPLKKILKKRTKNVMPSQKHSTLHTQRSQEPEPQDEWTQGVIARLPADLETQARTLKAFVRSRKLRSASDLLRGLFAYVYTTHSFAEVGMWSVLIGLADLSDTAWRKRLQHASAWLEWLLQELLAMTTCLSPWLVRGGLRRILLIDGTHWKCVGRSGIVLRVHTAFDLLAGRLTQVKVTDTYVGEKLEVFALQPGDLVVTDRANGLRTRIAFVRSKLAEIIVRISPSHFPMETERGEPIDLVAWLRSLNAKAGAIRNREVWISIAKQRIKLRLVALRLSEQQQEKAERRTKRKASKNQRKLQESTLYFAGWVLVVTTLPQDQWSDQHIMQLYQARWHIELLFKRIKQLLSLHALQCKTLLTAKATIMILLLGWALLEEESTQMRQAMREAMECTQQKRFDPARLSDSWWQEDLAGPLSEWRLASACFDLLCQQIRGSYTRERFHACLPRLQRFLGSGHRKKRPHCYTDVCRWLSIPETDTEPEVVMVL